MTKPLNPDLAQITSSIPEDCGVYLFYGADQLPVYIGKSVNLKQRVGSYFGGFGARKDDHIKRMVASATQIDYITTETELLALLLEDKLIKQHRPFYNKRSNGVDKYRYLAITTAAYPAIQMISIPVGPLGKIYGPFKDKYYAGRLMRFLQRLFGIRECTVDDPTKCRERSIYCAGPCKAAISVAEYANIVTDVEQFLSGNGDAAIERLEQSMLAQSEVEQYEQAAEFREMRDFVVAFTDRQRFGQAFLGGLTQITTNDEGLYIFDQGGRCAYLKESDNNWREKLVNLIDPALTIESPHNLLDRTLLVHQWLRKMGDQASCHFTP